MMDQIYIREGDEGRGDNCPSWLLSRKEKIVLEFIGVFIVCKCSIVVVVSLIDDRRFDDDVVSSFSTTASISKLEW